MPLLGSIPGQWCNMEAAGHCLRDSLRQYNANIFLIFSPSFTCRSLEIMTATFTSSKKKKGNILFILCLATNYRDSYFFFEMDFEDLDDFQLPRSEIEAESLEDVDFAEIISVDTCMTQMQTPSEWPSTERGKTTVCHEIFLFSFSLIDCDQPARPWRSPLKHSDVCTKSFIGWFQIISAPFLNFVLLKVWKAFQAYFFLLRCSMVRFNVQLSCQNWFPTVSGKNFSPPYTILFSCLKFMPFFIIQPFEKKSVGVGIDIETGSYKK